MFLGVVLSEYAVRAWLQRTGEMMDVMVIESHLRLFANMYRPSEQEIL